MRYSQDVLNGMKKKLGSTAKKKKLKMGLGAMIRAAFSKKNLRTFIKSWRKCQKRVFKNDVLVVLVTSAVLNVAHLRWEAQFCMGSDVSETCKVTKWQHLNSSSSSSSSSSRASAWCGYLLGQFEQLETVPRGVVLHKPSGEKEKKESRLQSES